jgi:hypothetical protein
MISGCFEVACPAASGHFQEVIDELVAECLWVALHLGVPVQLVGVGGGAVALPLQEVEQLDEVALQRVGAALAALEVVLPEVLVQQLGVGDGEVPVDPLAVQPLVQVPGRLLVVRRWSSNSAIVRPRLVSGTPPPGSGSSAASSLARRGGARLPSTASGLFRGRPEGRRLGLLVVVITSSPKRRWGS